MKKGILVSMVILLASAGIGYSQEGELHGTVDITYLSKYIWRGFDIYGDKSAIQPSIDLDLYGSGFGLNITGHRANSDKYENGERWDYTLYYANRFFDGESYATNYRLGWVYYNFPDSSAHSKSSIDLQELQAIFSWPDICPAGIVPTYVLVKLWPSNSNTALGSAAASRGTASGFAHIFMLDYGVPVAGLNPNNAGQILKLHTEFVYNDGVHPGGGNADHDWSNVVFSASTDYELADNLVLTPGIYHQVTMDDSVNDDKDETWVTLSMTYNF